MGSPAVCSLTNLPIPDCTPVLICYVKQARWHNPVGRPFEAYSPATPFVRADFREDQYLDIEDDQAELLKGYWAELTRDAVGEVEEFDPSDILLYFIERKYGKDNFLPYMIREDVWEQIGRLDFPDWKIDYRQRLTVDGYMGRERAKLLELAHKFFAERAAILELAKEFPHRYDAERLATAGHWERHDIERKFDYAEGERSEAIEHLLKRVFDNPPDTPEAFVEALAPAIEITRLWLALHYSRRAVFPIGQHGVQNDDYRNQITMTDIIREIAEKELAEKAQDDEED